MGLNQLTINKIRAAKPRAKYYHLSDGGGLFLRIQPTGAMSWYFTYRNDKKIQKWMLLGRYPDIPLYDNDHPERGARGMAEDARRLVGKGLDPLEEITRREAEAKREAERQALEAVKPATVEALFKRWKETELITVRDDKGNVLKQGRKDEGAEITRSFEKDVFPVIGKMNPHEIDHGHIMMVRDRIMARGVGRQANVILSNLRQMFGWGLIRKFCAMDPTSMIKKRDFGGTERERHRVLSDDEIVLLAKKLKYVGRAGLKRETQIALLLKMSVTCRIGELVKSEWRNVDWEARTLLFPKEVRKGNRNLPPKDHAVYLSNIALKLLKELHTRTGKTPYLFPDAKKDGPLNEKTITKQVGDRQRGENHNGRTQNTSELVLPGGHWTPHDLRRTGATIIVSLLRKEGQIKEAAEVTAEKCLSHVDPDRTRRTYNKYGYEPEMQHAWELLGAHLEALIPTEVLAPAPLPKKKPRPPGHAKAKQAAVESILDEIGAAVA